MENNYNIEKKNLYINVDKYNTDYNFYNFNKFKISKTIPIIYKSPTIFLDGLYFELPTSKLLNIQKKEDSMNYKLLISIDKNKDTIKLFNDLNNYNKDFFSINKDKFKLRIIKSNKNTGFRNTNNQFLDIKNPLIRQYNYLSFYTIKGDNIILSVEIKHNYLIKIINLSLLNKLDNEVNNISNEINDNYFDLKNKSLNINLSNLNLNIKFWIKCNNFIINEFDLIDMKWIISDYRLS